MSPRGEATFGLPARIQIPTRLGHDFRFAGKFVRQLAGIGQDTLIVTYEGTGGGDAISTRTKGVLISFGLGRDDRPLIVIQQVLANQKIRTREGCAF
jgi:hypothetical protein